MLYIQCEKKIGVFCFTYVYKHLFQLHIGFAFIPVLCTIKYYCVCACVLLRDIGVKKDENKKKINTKGNKYNSNHKTLFKVRL